MAKSKKSLSKIKETYPKEHYKYMGFLTEYIADSGDSTKGLTEKKVVEIEAQLGVTFPVSYRELYLLLGGNWAFNIVGVNDYRFPEFEEMRAYAKCYFEACEQDSEIKSDLVFTDNLFVFSVFKQNGFFSFFYLDEGENPAIYEYEGGNGYYKIAEDMADFIINKVGWYEGYLIGKRWEEEKNKKRI
ncbi:SMI1/KNR4 family protein [Xanthocytophaga agilis]|nr:SMI1/KNR4 family protein [Xanthocytophaga agilis]